MLDHLIVGLTAALQLKQFLFMVLGTVIGLWVGVLPGLGGPVAMAILIPFTFAMDPLSALLMLASISVGAAFGGSVTSILLNIPGEASSAATAYDGYPMAQQGKAKVAMGLSAGASMAAAIVGVLILMFASGPVAKAALAFSPAEYFALAILGLTVVSVAALGSTTKGLAMGALGIAISAALPASREGRGRQLVPACASSGDEPPSCRLGCRHRATESGSGGSVPYRPRPAARGPAGPPGSGRRPADSRAV